MSPPDFLLISTSTVQPWRTPHCNTNTPHRCNLTPFDLALLSVHYIQKGLLFHKPLQSDAQDQSFPTIVARLRHSLSQALSYFTPLAGRLATEPDPSSSSTSTSVHISIDCNGAGAQFIHTVAAGTTVADVISPPDVPPFVRSFFPLDGAIGYDGHSLPLLAVQLTELLDGFFLACAFSHVVGDGAAFWHFFSSWAEITRKTVDIEETDCAIEITRPPVLRRVFIRDFDASPVPLPISKPEKFISRFRHPPLRERFFHFTAQSIKKLKAEANEERHKTDDGEISSFQALTAHVWRSFTRARRLPDDSANTGCFFAVDNRSRLVPPLSGDYFGNGVTSKRVTATGGELLANGLGWAASLLHDSVVSHDDANVRQAYHAWLGAPVFYSFEDPVMLMDGGIMMVGSSPRFDVYGVDFGWGKAVAVRSGRDNKFDGRVIAFPGREGGGSVDLEICLAPEVMCALESDEEFMDTVESPSA